MPVCFRWTSDASDLLDPAYAGVFGAVHELGINKDHFRTSLHKFIEDPGTYAAVKQHLQGLMPNLLICTKTQLKDFFPGEKYGGQQYEGLEHAPLTNLLGENVFGDLDYDMGRRRNTSMYQRTAWGMNRHNRTGDWLAEKGLQETAALFEYARPKARQLRDQHREQERIVRQRLREKMEEKKRL